MMLGGRYAGWQRSRQVGPGPVGHDGGAGDGCAAVLADRTHAVNVPAKNAASGFVTRHDAIWSVLFTVRARLVP